MAPHPDPTVLSSVIEAAPTPLWVIGGDGTVVLANSAAVTLLGYRTTDEVVGAPSHDTLHSWHPDGRRYHAESCPILDRSAVGTATSEVEWFITRDDRVMPVLWSTRALGAGGHTLLSFVDATESLPVQGSGRGEVGDDRFAAESRDRSARSQLRTEILHRISTRFSDPDFDAGMLARECHLSLRTVQQVLAEAGRSPAAEIRDHRVTHAATLLQGGATVQSAARASGFSDSKTFSRAFHRKFHTTPGNWSATAVSAPSA